MRSLPPTLPPACLCPSTLRDIAVVAGMLHDVGKLILAWKLSEHFEKMPGGGSARQLPGL